MNDVVEVVAAGMAQMQGEDPQQAALVARWQKAYKHALDFEEATHKRFTDDRRVARGETEWQVDTNLVGAILEILNAFVYAKDPDVSVTVAPSVNNTRKKSLQDVTETLQVVISRLCKDANLRKVGQRWTRSASTVGEGWLCPALQTRTETDPQIKAEINDLEEQLKNIETLEKNVLDGESKDPDADKQRIKDNMKALQAKLERVIATGLVIDFYRPENIIVSTECEELVDYVNAPCIFKRLYRSKFDAQKQTGWSGEVLKGANLYRRRPQAGESGDAQAMGGQAYEACDKSDSESLEGFVCFVEVWSKVDGMVYTFVEGIKDRWARAPFAPTTGSRFYDCFLLGFHYIDGERHPQSDVQQLKRLQDEYGRTRSNFAEHRKRSVPMTYWNGHEVDDAQLDRINSAEAGENVAVRTTSGGGVPMSNLLYRTSGVGFDPAMYSTDPIRSDMEKVSGAQDAMQASVQVAKTATEAGIQNEGFGARIGVRRGELEAVLSEMMLYIAQIALQGLSESYVVRLAGIEAVWPKLSVDEIMYAFDIEVKAGSTGKPDMRKKREAWAALMPNIEKMIVAIGNFLNAGKPWAAEPYVQMLRYTAEVLEFEGDIDKFIPVPPPVNPVQQAVEQITAAATGQPTAPAMVPMMDSVGTQPGDASTPA